VLFATQGRRHSAWVRLAARFAAPEMCVAQSAATLEQARRLGWPTLCLPPGVDLNEFRPVRPDQKSVLRRQFGLPVAAAIALHAGHLNRGRGVLDLAAIADLVTPVLISSTSTPQDGAVKDELEAAGVRVVTRYIPNIAQLYAAADAYVFPVPPQPLASGSIDVPLSVLEAAACGLPVVTTRFGALPEIWPAEAGIRYYESRTELRAAMIEVAGARLTSGAIRALAEPYGWDSLARKLLGAVTGTAKDA
jgi:glycosyltransferase involved in cell wall biosynthesis